MPRRNRTPGPAVAATRLRSRLVQYRMQADLTQVKVADAMDWSESKLHRIENGPGRIQTSDLLAMLTLYDVMDIGVREQMVDLARASRAPSTSSRWGRDLSLKFAEYLDYEAFASSMMNFETKLVPGLLQIGGYADPTVEAYLDTTDDDQRIAGTVSAREERAQQVTGKDGPTASFIIDESALHRAVGGEDLAWDKRYDTMLRVFANLRRLNTVGASLNGLEVDPDVNPALSIQIVPFERGSYPALRGPFVVLDFEDTDDPPLVYLENPDGEEILRSIESIGHYKDQWLELQGQIPGADHTSEILDYIQSDFDNRVQNFPYKTRPVRRA